MFILLLSDEMNEISLPDILEGAHQLLSIVPIYLLEGIVSLKRWCRSALAKIDEIIVSLLPGVYPRDAFGPVDSAGRLSSAVDFEQADGLPHQIWVARSIKVFY
jgi:hypothetical protein